MTLRVGYFPNNNSLFVLRHQGLLEQSIDVTWVDLRDLDQGQRPDPRHGLPTLHGDHLFSDQGYDVIGTGFTPPITALGHGHDVVYLGRSEPRVENGRLLVLGDSPIRSVADLAGKRVALSHGSWQTTLVLFALDDVGLGWSDIEPVDAGDDAGELLVTGQVDAWVGSYPSLAPIEQQVAVRTLIETDGLFSHPSLWFTRRDVAETRPEEVRAVLAALQESDRWITTHPREAAQFFADDARAHGRRGDVDQWEAAILGRPYGIRPVDEDFLAEQQRAADLFVANGLLPRPVDVHAAVVPWIGEQVEQTLVRSS